MATPPRRSKDPTELALSAIEDALNVREPESAPAPRRPADEPEQLPPRRRARLVQDDDDMRDSDRNERLPELMSDRDDRREPRMAANDDRENVGRLLRALQRRPSRTPSMVAWVFAASWVVFFAGLVFGTFASTLGPMLSQGIGSTPLVIGLVACFVAPIVFLFVVANMISRAQELRLIGQSM